MSTFSTTQRPIPAPHGLWQLGTLQPSVYYRNQPTLSIYTSCVPLASSSSVVFTLLTTIRVNVLDDLYQSKVALKMVGSVLLLCCFLSFVVG